MSLFSKYIVAVSGGVDSVVLLHMLVENLRQRDLNPPPGSTSRPRYIVAHFDHGMRADSAEDAVFVGKLAASYGLEFETKRVELGANASEQVAREARYGYLKELKQRYKAEKIITAHHQDDLIESMVTNLLRGTGPRGLLPMSNVADIVRPLLRKSKADLVKYARTHRLQWREDSTNSDEKYLRNYIRAHITPRLDQKEFLRLHDRLQTVYDEIDHLILGFLPKRNIVKRAAFVTLPYVIQKEVIRVWMKLQQIENVNRQQIERIVAAVKTLPIHKKMDINGEWWLQSEVDRVVFTKKR